MQAELDWFAVRTRSKHEFQVFERLGAAGVQAFLPHVDKISRWSDRKKLIRSPLFPGYLFVNIEKSREALLCVQKTKGVAGILGYAPGEPEPVPREQILSLQKLVEAKVHLDPYPYLQEGQRVRIKGGPLAGVEGILAQKTDRHLLVLSVDMLRQSTALTINAWEVEEA